MRKLLKDCLYILFIVTILFFISDQPSFSGTLKFAQISDIHFSTVRNDNGYKLLSQTKPLLTDAINQVNNEKNIDFVMLTGDVIDRPNKESLDGAIQVINTLNYPWYYVVGNHDRGILHHHQHNKLDRVFHSYHILLPYHERYQLKPRYRY